MNWIGAGIGAVLGSARGGGILGGVAGALIGNWAEEKIRAAIGKPSASKPAPPPENDVRDPYAVLGCPPTATDEEVCAAYREKAKRLHPDTLRAQGIPDEIVAAANEQMAGVNAAWSAIRRQRNL